MRIGLIGLGRIGAFHADTLAALDRGDELVVTDPVAAAVDTVTTRIRKATAVGSPEAVLDAGVDGVVIAATTGAHAGLLLASARRGIPTFCEKPIAGSADEAVTVRDRLAGSGVAVRWVTWQEAVEVYAVGAVDPDAGCEFYADNGDWSSASVLITLDDGSIGVVSNSRTNARGYDVRLEVHGVADAVAAGLDDGLPLRATQPGVTWPGGPPHSFFMDRLAEAFRRELATFCSVAAGGVPSPCTIEDAMGTAWIAEAATLSVTEHRPVRIDEVAR